MTLATWIRAIARQLIYWKRERIVKRSLSCKGWTDERQLRRIYSLLQSVEEIEGDILEIGSAWGRSTVLLGLSTSKSVWSIDPHTGGRAYIEKDEVQDSYADFCHNLARFGLLDKTCIIKKTTAEVLSHSCVDDSVCFSFAYIDGLHTAEGVKVDFDFAYARLTASGILVFDDYFASTVPDYSAMIDQLSVACSNPLQKDEDAKLVWIEKQ